MFCTKCGKELQNGEAFCTNCGAAVKDMQPQSYVNPVEEAENGLKTNIKKPFLIGAGIVGIAVVALVAVIAAGRFSLFSEPKTDGGGGSDRTKKEKVESTDEETADETEEQLPTEINGITLLSADTPEGKIQSEIFRMNDSAYEEASIDVYAQNHVVGARNAAAIWDNTVFYVLEGYRSVTGYQAKNVCTLIKKELRNAVSGNIMQYEIYYNAAADVANKIVSIEYLSNGLEVTEYYYGNDKKVNFIFQYFTDNYISSFATPDKFGDRYLFCNDSVVTWRSITAAGTVNYILGDAEAERMKGQFAKTTMVYYGNLAKAGQDEFDERERRMLNAAYNTYDTVNGSAGIARIRGDVFNEDNVAISDAVVELYAEDFSTLLYSAETDSAGMYSICVPNQTYKYNIRIKRDNMTSADIYSIEMSNEQIGAYQDRIYLFDNATGSVGLQLMLGDAFTYAADGNGMMRLANASVFFRKGVNNRYGTVILQTTADNAGCLAVSLAPDVYTIEVQAVGYATMYYTVIVNPKVNNIHEFYATPTLNDDEYAIVLTWGEHPYDLDSHLFTNVANSVDHIWYGKKNDAFNSYLDVDDTDSYGPETVTILDFNAANYYKYCVVDYTNCANGYYNSQEMSYSGASVHIYSSAGLIASYSVPTGLEGVIWEVFEIRNGRVTPIQRYYSNVDDKTWWHGDK